jgi:glycerophosphoryl diester phosphodiesterase
VSEGATSTRTAAARKAAYARWRREPGRPPHVLGHRGARREAIENTMAAFERAIELGAAGVELDVRLDGDGEVIVLHDRTLTRVAGDDRDVETLGRDELARFRMPGGERVPTLADVLDWSRAKEKLVNVELKRDVSSRRKLCARVAELLRDSPGASERILLSSFDPLIVRTVAWLLPSFAVGWLIHEKQRLLRFAPGWRALGAVALHPSLALASSPRVERDKAAGALVNVWTVNDPSEAHRLARAGADAIISDVPGRIVRALE